MLAPQTLGLYLPASPAVFKKKFFENLVIVPDCLNIQHKAAVKRRGFYPISLMITKMMVLPPSPKNRPCSSEKVF